MKTKDIIEALPLAALIVGPDERILDCNDGAKAILGSSLIGRHFITVLRQPMTLDAIERVREDGGRQIARFTGRSQARETTWKVHVTAVEHTGGPSVLVVFEDTSAVEEAENMRRDFVSNVGHELKTPLTSLIAFIQTLRGPARDDAAARDRFLAIMAREADRMSQLVSDLLSLSRVEENERRRPTEPVDLVTLVRATQSALEPMAEAAKVTIVTEFSREPTVVPGDPEQLRQVVSNLMENAIKYGGVGGTVRVALSGVSNEPGIRTMGVCLTVRDEGEGIEPHHLPRLTERFYRIDRHRSREVGGTGLGLAIVKHIVNRHRGRLRIDSTPGQGTRVSVVLPASLPEP